MAPSETIGLIGVGLLGTALGSRLVQAGFPVMGYDPDPAAAVRLRSAGAQSVDSAESVASSCMRILLSLPAPPEVAETIARIEPVLTDGAIVLDSTTGDPTQVEQTAARLRSRNVHYLDCEVGGSSLQVQRGEAILMCGGEETVQEACQDIFRALTNRVFFTGPAGSGTRMKLTLNIAVGLHRAVMAESLAFAKASGIDPCQALEVLKAGPGYSKAMDVKGARMISGDFSRPEARLLQHLKDVRLILKTGMATGARLPLSALHEQLLAQAEEAGYGAEDNSAILKVFDFPAEGIS